MSTKLAREKLARRLGGGAGSLHMSTKLGPENLRVAMEAVREALA